MRRASVILALGLCAACVPSLAAPPKPAAPAAQSAAKYDDARLKALEAKLAKKPHDAKLKNEVAAASYHYGHQMMLDPDLPPRVKYPGALKHFRRALVLNPKHQKAASEKQQIEDIYKEMGRPIPQ